MTRDFGRYRLAISNELPPCAFVPVGWREFEVANAAAREVMRAAVSVELVELAGGMMPSGLIGGEFIPFAAPLSWVEIAHSGAMTKGRSPDCVGSIHRAFMAGLPAEFADRVAAGMRLSPDDVPWARGVYRVAAGAYDEVESNPITFERLGGLLRIALSSAAFGETLNERLVRGLVERWR